jgi:hypothetical protein
LPLCVKAMHASKAFCPPRWSTWSSGSAARCSPRAPPELPRAKRAGKANPSYRTGNHTRERRTLENTFRDVYRDLCRIGYRPDALHSRIRGRVVHLRLLLNMGVGHEGLAVAREPRELAHERFLGVYITPKAALPLLRCRLLIARYLLALLRDSASTGTGTGPRTTRETSERFRKNQVDLQEFEAKKAKALADLEQLARSG